MQVVIISNAKAPELHAMTVEAVKSANADVYVFEQNLDAEYDDCKTVYTTHIIKEFNYNKIANIGMEWCNSDNIVISNNDVIFQPGWAEELLKANYPIVSPVCPNDARQFNLDGNEIGDRTGRHLTGWCFMIRRSLWEEIGGFDEDFPFWCADNSLMEQLIKIGTLPMVVPSAKVIHLMSRTFKLSDNKQELTHDQVVKFNHKYKKSLSL